MTLLNNFYTLSERTNEGNELHAIIHLQPEHEIFQGHFPNQPVVPGVCMVQIVKEMMEGLVEKKLLFRKSHQIKFLQLLVPAREDAIQVTILWQEDEGQYTVNADFKKDNNAVFKLNGIFQ